MSKIVTRFAPSPTGFMHVGGIRTALYAWLWAKKNDGTFILRIEDTDKEREVEGSKEHIIKALNWLGMTPDEGPYYQSERLELYKKYAQKLIDAGFAYPDPYTQEEVASFREEAEKEKKPFLYRNHRPEETTEWDGSTPLRFKTPVKTYTWTDVVRGELTMGEEMVDDFILIKADGYPTYNFAHIVDDIEMGVNLVVRGEEFLSSMPKFLALYEALAVEAPQFVTTPPVLADGGKKKLSKRDGAKDILAYKEEGYLPDALLNFLALLGWHPEGDQEFLTRDELITAFDIARIQKSGAQLDPKKLDWLNREHIKSLSQAEKENLVSEYFPKELTDIVMERITTLSEIKTLKEEGEFDFFFEKPTVDMEKVCFKETSLDDTKIHTGKIREILEGLSDWNLETIKVSVMEYADSLEKRGPALHPFRYMLSGKDKSPDPFTIASILGKEETLARLVVQ